MELSDKKVAILVSNFFEEVEFTEPLKALKKAGMQVTVVATESKSLQALSHADKAGVYQADELLADADPDAYHALVLPGGVFNADLLRMNEMAQEWVAAYIDAKKPVAAICHAPWLLVSAGVVHDRTLTSFATLQDDVRNAGGTWVDRAVVVDGTIITSRKPDDLPVFIEAILSAVKEDNEE